MIFGPASSSLLPLALLAASASAAPAWIAPAAEKAGNVARAVERSERNLPSHARRTEQRARAAAVGKKAKRSTAAKEAEKDDFPSNSDILDSITKFAAAAESRQNNLAKAKRALDFTVGVDDLAKREGGDTVLRKRTSACLGSSATDTDINSAFFYGGAGTTVSLCAGATINLSNPVVFTAASQELSTEGYPTDDTRATLVVTGSNQANAVTTTCGACDFSSIRNIQVNGQRPSLGYMSTGAALIEVGGSNNGQVVDNVHTYEPRGWSALHIIEGNLDCTNTTISNNQVGPSGNSPSGSAQFRKRDSSTPAGQWADGISLSCSNSVVRDNVITDATDGAIVIFGAPGSHIHHNTIVSNTRHTMGGINAVDYAPYSGDYTGTIVEQNTIIANTSFIKVGMGLGGMVWGSDNQTAVRTSGGLFQNNVFKSGSSGYFGYAVAVAGHEDATVLDNDATAASFGGTPSSSCIPSPMVPTAQAYVFDQWTTPGSVLQSNFVNEQLVFLICNGPGSIVGKGEESALTDDLLTVSDDSKTVTSTAGDIDDASELIDDDDSTASRAATTSAVADSTTSTIAAIVEAAADVVTPAKVKRALPPARTPLAKRYNPFELLEAAKRR